MCNSSSTCLLKWLPRYVVSLTLIWIRFPQTHPYATNEHYPLLIYHWISTWTLMSDWSKVAGLAVDTSLQSIINLVDVSFSLNWFALVIVKVCWQLPGQEDFGSFQCRTLTKDGNKGFWTAVWVSHRKIQIVAQSSFSPGGEELSAELSVLNVIQWCLNYRLNLQLNSNPVQVKCWWSREIFSGLMQQSSYLLKILPCCIKSLDWYGW